ncbi:hypothetical protein EVAR_27524_1 [Eumeta japonica]|uniref:Uncharacterized protein n=1 Tax=Eumeta variegata TaxID=151549 RepID=A0A4C1W6V1_EUMVA|nr:hypothetical protein EVAR_27524_1 [Eumeta japonica]
MKYYWYLLLKNQLPYEASDTQIRQLSPAWAYNEFLQIIHLLVTCFRHDPVPAPCPRLRPRSRPVSGPQSSSGPETGPIPNLDFGSIFLFTLSQPARYRDPLVNNFLRNSEDVSELRETYIPMRKSIHMELAVIFEGKRGYEQPEELPYLNLRGVTIGLPGF